MNSKDNQSKDAIGLRKKAEEVIRAKEFELSENIDGMTPEETRRTLHELRVHQIELEMQNEELRRSQTELDAARERYFDLYDLAPVGYVTISEKGLILEANLTIATMLGAARGALVNKLLSRFIHKDDQEIYYRQRKQLFATDVPLACDLRMVKKDGTVFWASLRSTSSQYPDGPPVWRVVVSDITERKRAEEHLRSIADNTYEWEYWRAPDGKYIWVSPSCTAISGYYPEEFTGEAARRLADIIHQDDLHIWEKHLKEMDGNQPEHQELDFRILKPTGETVWICHTCKPIFDREGLYLGRRGSNRDITARKLAEKQIIEMKDRAEAGSRSKSEFLANMSHEIRTPLNGIMGMLQLIEMTSTDDDQKEYLRAALKSSGRLASLLTDILDLSRIEVGRFFLCESSCSVQNIEVSLNELFAIAAKEKGLILEFFFDDRMPSIFFCDENRLMQILFNLVGNSIKFTQKGSVCVEISPLPDTSLARILFTVSDTGIGIPDELLPYIFEPFVQGDETHTKRFQGAGLGLSIVRRLVRMMDGELAIDSAEGEGTTMYLSLPLKLSVTPQVHLEPAASIPRSSSSDTPLQILFAEDDEANLMAGKKLLEKSGYAVMIAENGQEVLNLLAEHEFDLILMDIQMPVMDGVEATKAIRISGASYASIPIVAMTAFAMVGDKEEFLDAGMDDYIAKPVVGDRPNESIRCSPNGATGCSPNGAIQCSRNGAI